MKVVLGFKLHLHRKLAPDRTPQGYPPPNGLLRRIMIGLSIKPDLRGATQWGQGGTNTLSLVTIGMLLVDVTGTTEGV